MTYYLFFLIYVAGGILICGVLFSWAVANGQFKDQDRARYLPLAGEAPRGSDAASARWPAAMRLTVAVLGCLAAVQVVLALLLALIE